MECSSCHKPVRWVFELLEDVPGGGPTKQRLCFPCISTLGEELMRPRAEVNVRCTKCDEPVPKGFYECRGDGSHPSVGNLPTVR